MARALAYGALVATALIVQLTVLDVLPLPGGIAPDLVLLVVVAIALTNGPLPGLVVGFAAGLALDLAPPASHAIGAYALVFCLTGYVCGSVAGEIDRSAFLPIAAMAARCRLRFGPVRGRRGDIRRAGRHVGRGEACAAAFCRV